MSAAPLHVLHVGSGFRPLRWGGLVAYVEDLMAEQVRSGQRVSYFFSGRYYRRPRGQRLRRWSSDGVAMVEVVNSPLHDHGRQPELEISEPGIERAFAGVLAELCPDIVHVQELAGLPSSLIDVAADTGIPVAMTLQDYFPLCSTFKLLDADGRVCLRREIGEDCRAAVQAEARRSSVMFESTARYELERAPLLDRVATGPRETVIGLLSRPKLVAPSSARVKPPLFEAAFQRRREVNLERLNRCDRLIAMSSRLAEIYAELGVEPDRLTTMQLTLAHIEQLTPRRRDIGDPLTFATLGGGESVAKGSSVLLDAVRRLNAEAGPGRFRLLVFGRCDRHFEAVIADLANVERRASYRPAQLDDLLEEVDVGLMPSIWEEAYGYAGMEFIAKGIPVISNPIGGMADYVHEGETGWFNRSSSGRGLAETMKSLVTDPEAVRRVADATGAARAELVLTMPDHQRAMAETYRTVIDS